MPDDINSILGVASDSPPQSGDIHFECPTCSQPIDAPKELVTQLIECPACKQTIEVPVRSQHKEAPKPPEPPKPGPAPATPQKFELPPIEDSGVAIALTIIAVLEFIGSPIAGLSVGGGYDGNVIAGWIVFISGVISGLIFLGFARIIQNTFESSQRLRRLEMLMERDYDKKRAA